MSELIIGSGFQSSIEVITAGDRAVGAWVRMASWSLQWAELGVPQPIPKHSARMFGCTKSVARDLVAASLLGDDGDHWIILGEGDLWRQSVPARSRIPDRIRQLVYERDEHTCQFCGAVENLSLDHIIPWSLGGPDTVENLRVLCRPCNSSRGNRMEVDA